MQSDLRMHPSTSWSGRGPHHGLRFPKTAGRSSVHDTMDEIIVIQTPDGSFLPWRAASLAKLQLGEKALEAAIVAEPGPLILNPIELLHGSVAVYEQRGLQSGSGHTSIPDVILITDHGDIVVVEVKRLGNPDLRGRAVIAQVVDYAASLSTLDETSLVSALTKGQSQSYDELCRVAFPNAPRLGALAERIRRRTANAEIQIVIASDIAPEALSDWVRAAGRQTAVGFDLHVVEIRPFVSVDSESGITWLPRSRVRTEIVHRTVVSVHTSGGEVHVDVRADSAEQVEEAVRSSGRPSQRARALDVIMPLADSLSMSPEELWSELDAIHQHALAADWGEGVDSLAEDGDAEPYLRGRRTDGFIEGRFGVNLVKAWRPSVFVGGYFLPVDHRQPLLAPDTGGDFALILDIDHGKHFDGDAFRKDGLFQKLKARLVTESGAWDFQHEDGLQTPNRWHPLFLRRPLADVLAGASTPEQRQARWMLAAQDAVQILLAGGELASLHARFRSPM